MADPILKTLPELTAAGAVSDTDLTPIYQGASPLKKITTLLLRAYVLSGAASVITFLQAGVDAVSRTLQSKLEDTVNVRDFGGVCDGVTDDLAAWNRAVAAVILAGGGTVQNKRGAVTLVSGTLEVQAGSIAGTTRGVTIDLNGGQIVTSANVPVIQVGADAASTSAYRSCGVINGVIRGAGTGQTANYGLVVRNHSDGDFTGLRIVNCGAKALVLQAYGRGVQHNDFRGTEIVDNFDGSILLDSGAEPGGYINDNKFDTVRCHENPLSGGAGVIQWHFIGSQGEVNKNTFINSSCELQVDTQIGLKIERGESNDFISCRLDGTDPSTILDIAATCPGNRFIGVDVQGVITDASKASLVLSDQGSSDFPYMRFGAAGGGEYSFDIGIAEPSSAQELSIKYNGSTPANGPIRIGGGTLFYIGDSNNGSADIEFQPASKRMDLRTLSGVAMSAGPSIRWDARFSSTGNYGTCIAQADIYGLAYTFSLTGKMLYSSGGFAMIDGMTAPSAVVGRAQLFVDTADGDLKVIFGDGVVKTLATDT